MTGRNALPDEDLSAWPDDGYGYGADDGYDDTLWEIQPSAAPMPASRQAPPWYRSPRLLLLLIGLAAAVLVVATALLVTGRTAGEIPRTPRLETRTATSVPPASASSTPSGTVTPASSSAPASPTPERTTEPSPEAAPEPAEPAASAAAPPPAAPSRSPQGPRINVTRTPMSFTPGKVG